MNITVDGRIEMNYGLISISRRCDLGKKIGNGIDIAIIDAIISIAVV